MYNTKFKLKFSFQNFLLTLCFLLATPHSHGLWCSIETLFSILFSVFLKLFSSQLQPFELWSIHVKCFILFKFRFFFQKLSKFIDPFNSDVIFRFDLHHIQMDATLFSCCHKVLIQFSGLICTTYNWMQPYLFVAIRC